MINEIIEFVKHQVNVNQFFSAAFFISIMGTVGFYLKGVPVAIWQFIKRRFIFTVTIYDNDQIFYDFENWFFKNSSKNYRSVEASSSPTFNFNQNQGNIQPNDGFWRPSDNIETPKVYFKQNTGIFIIKYKGRLIYIDKTKDKVEKSADVKTFFLHQYKISCWFGKSVITELLHNALTDRVKSTSEKEVSVFTHNSYGDWTFDSKISAKNIDNVILRDDLMQNILSDLEEFENNEEWYIKASILYKRGYIFHGPPGNGKTSLCMALARHKKRDLFVIDLNSFSDNDCLRRAIRTIPAKAIMVIEDVDATFIQRENVTESKITFNTFLNCLDGISSKHGLLTFLTTNYIEKLDSALLRKGRMDVKIEIENPSTAEISKYLSVFYSEDIKINEYHLNLSMCDVQEICVQNKENPDKAIEALTAHSQDLKIA